MGRVYLAHETTLDRRVALKVLPPALADHPEVVQRFQREGRMAAKLTHPNIVAVYKVAERDGLYFFTMPYVAGPSVRQVLRQTPQLSIELSRRYLCEAADALSYAHSRDVIHRDIKPENMLLEGSRDGRLLLTDFGIAKVLGAETALTRPGDMMGTPFFMSPEQCGQAEDIDGRSDQYSLGLVAYEMLAGRFPFSADNLAGIVYMHVHEYPEPLENIRSDVPEGLLVVINRAIRKDPDERFPDMAAMLRALGASAASRRTAKPAAPAPPGKPRRRRWAPLAIAGFIALVVGGGGFAVWQQRTSASSSGEPRLAEVTVPQDAGTAALDSITDSEAATPDDSTARTGAAVREQETGDGAALDPAGAEDPGLATYRRDAEQARDRAQRAREAALGVGADTMFAVRYAEINGDFDGAQSDLRDGRLVTAAMGFATVREDFEELERQVDLRLERLAAAAERLGDEGLQDPAAIDSTPVEEVPAPTPREAIDLLIESYRQAIETKDRDRLSQEVYRGSIPESDADDLDVWFERAENLAVTIEVEDFRVTGDEAQARIRQQMAFRLIRTGERRSTALTLRMYFSRSGDDWRLVRFER
jgi:hypothetical protein